MHDNNIQLSKTMSNILISIGRTADLSNRIINLSQAHSILIAGGSESLRNALVSSMRADLETVAVDVVYVDSKGLSRIDEEVATIEAFASEVNERLTNEAHESEEKVLIVSDYADYILMPGKVGRAYASRVRKSCWDARDSGCWQAQCRCPVEQPQEGFSDKNLLQDPYGG